jgi:uncharacterized protein
VSNPFHYGSPAEGPHFAGRADELDALVSRMRNGISVVLISPRRYGKTSLHRAAQVTLARSRPAAAVIEVNVLRATSLASLAAMLTSGAYHLNGARWKRARQAVPEFLRRLRVTPTVSFDAAGSPRFGFEAGAGVRDVELVLADVFALLAEAAEHRPAVLVLDEFQAITRHAASFPDLLKALADEHPAVSLVLAGSRRHLMEELVVHTQAPLYGMAQRLALGPIPDAAMIEYLCRRAREAGKPLDPDTAGFLVRLGGPVPNDIQHLAFEAFEVAATSIDRAAVDDGLRLAVDHEATVFAENLLRLSPGQGRVLAALAIDPPDEPYGAAFARSVGLANASSVRKAIQPLVATEDVVVVDGRLTVADPFFAAWLRGQLDAADLIRPTPLT